MFRRFGKLGASARDEAALTLQVPSDGGVRSLRALLDQLDHASIDVASLAVKWHKPLSARLLPVAGKKAGERTEFDDPFLVNATLQPLP